MQNGRISDLTLGSIQVKRKRTVNGFEIMLQDQRHSQPAKRAARFINKEHTLLPKQDANSMHAIELDLPLKFCMRCSFVKMLHLSEIHFD